MLLPKLKEFQPDLLFISAGFDAHYDDFYHFLTEEDIHWVTMEMCQIVQENPNSLGVISILEGGYSLESKSKTVTTKEKPTKASSGGAKGNNSNNSNNKSNTNGNTPEMVRVVDPSTMFGQQSGDGGLVKG
jgi:acetoin utilization deacetylase AcuC-like enzyme